MSCKFLRLAFELVEGYLTERGPIETGVCNLSKSRSMAQWETLHSLARSSNTASPYNHRAEIEIDGGYRIEGTHMLISTRPIGLAKASTPLCLTPNRVISVPIGKLLTEPWVKWQNPHCRPPPNAFGMGALRQYLTTMTG